MPPSWTIADLMPGQFVTAYCLGCDRSGDLDLAAIIERFGPVPILDLRRRLRCSACHGRAEIRIAYGLP